MKIEVTLGTRTEVDAYNVCSECIFQAMPCHELRRKAVAGGLPDCNEYPIIYIAIEEK